MSTPENEETTTVAACPHLSGGLERIEQELKDLIDEAGSMITAETRGGNVVKENWWRGKLAGLRVAQMLLSNDV